MQLPSPLQAVLAPITNNGQLFCFAEIDEGAKCRIGGKCQSSYSVCQDLAFSLLAAKGNLDEIRQVIERVCAPLRCHRHRHHDQLTAVDWVVQHLQGSLLDSGSMPMRERKNFVCSKCGICVARKDSLRRHSRSTECQHPGKFKGKTALSSSDVSVTGLCNEGQASAVATPSGPSSIRSSPDRLSRTGHGPDADCGAAGAADAVDATETVEEANPPPISGEHHSISTRFSYLGPDDEHFPLPGQASLYPGEHIDQRCTYNPIGSSQGYVSRDAGSSFDQTAIVDYTPAGEVMCLPPLLCISSDVDVQTISQSSMDVDDLSTDHHLVSAAGQVDLDTGLCGIMFEDSTQQDTIAPPYYHASNCFGTSSTSLEFINGMNWTDRVNTTSFGDEVDCIDLFLPDGLDVGAANLGRDSLSSTPNPEFSGGNNGLGYIDALLSDPQWNTLVRGCNADAIDSSIDSSSMVVDDQADLLSASGHETASTSVNSDRNLSSSLYIDNDVGCDARLAEGYGLDEDIVGCGSSLGEMSDFFFNNGTADCDALLLGDCSATGHTDRAATGVFPFAMPLDEASALSGIFDDFQPTDGDDSRPVDFTDGRCSGEMSMDEISAFLGVDGDDNCDDLQFLNDDGIVRSNLVDDLFLAVATYGSSHSDEPFLFTMSSSDGDRFVFNGSGMDEAESQRWFDFGTYYS